MFDATWAGHQARVEVLEREGCFQVRLGDQTHTLDVRDVGHGFLSLIVDGRAYEVGLERQGPAYVVHLQGQVFAVELQPAARGAAAVAVKAQTGPARVCAPMPGKIVRVLVEAGTELQAGQALIVIEAMKMENELRAPRGGRLRVVHVKPGQTVESGALLAEVE